MKFWNGTVKNSLLSRNQSKHLGVSIYSVTVWGALPLQKSMDYSMNKSSHMTYLIRIVAFYNTKLKIFGYFINLTAIRCRHE